MPVYIFRGPGRVFGFTAHAAGENLPSRYAPWTAFKAVEMIRGQAMPGMEVDACLDDLEIYGFHITDAHVRITEDVAL
jgi:hypothetical protein